MAPTSSILALTICPSVILGAATKNVGVRGTKSIHDIKVESQALDEFNNPKFTIPGKLCQDANPGAKILPVLKSHSNGEFSKLIDGMKQQGLTETMMENELNNILRCNDSTDANGLEFTDFQRRLQTNETTVPFYEITGRGYMFDKNYFDGGTSFNDGLFHINKALHASRIQEISEVLGDITVDWPYNVDINRIDNFDDVNSCQLQTVMCCFTQLQDVNGNNSPIGDTADLANSEVCAHDMSNAPTAARTKRGKTYYKHGTNTEFPGEDDAYCTGFTWVNNSGEDSLEYKFRANALVHISLVDGFYNQGQNGKTGAIPGAPMCGCVEKMPTVTKSACVKPVEVTAVRLLLQEHKDEGSRSEDAVPNAQRSLQASTKIEFQPCNPTDDLVSHYQSMGGDVDALSEHVVGSGGCDVAVDKALALDGYARGNAWWHVSTDQWTPVMGMNQLYHPWMLSPLFQSHYALSSTKIILRVCKSCMPSHRMIYYKRLTPIPPEMDLYTYLTASWVQLNNVMGVDFELYSTYEDVISGENAWTFCNYNSGRGFPNECGPDENTKGIRQWTHLSSSSTYAKQMAFYLEK